MYVDWFWINTFVTLRQTLMKLYKCVFFALFIISPQHFSNLHPCYVSLTSWGPVFLNSICNMVIRGHKSNLTNLDWLVNTLIQHCTKATEWKLRMFSRSNRIWTFKFWLSQIYGAVSGLSYKQLSQIRYRF